MATLNSMFTEALSDLIGDDRSSAAGEIVEQMRADLLRVKPIWDLTCIVNSTMAEWKQVLWTDLNPTQMEDETKLFQKATRSADKSVKNWDNFRAVDGAIKNFLIAIPCVADLKSPSMRDRHCSLLKRPPSWWRSA